MTIIFLISEIAAAHLRQWDGADLIELAHANLAEIENIPPVGFAE